MFDLSMRALSRAAVLSALWSTQAHADHVPERLSQELDPDLISCMLAVDDASIQFITSLQSSCIARISEVCGLGDAAVLVEETITCLNFETRQAVDFLVKVANELPLEIEAEGLRARATQRRLQSLRDDVRELDLADEPLDIEGSIRRYSKTFGRLHIALLTARETDTNLEGLVQYNGDSH
jgi:hypothetical protein